MLLRSATVDLASSHKGDTTLTGFEDVVGSAQGDDIVGDGEANRLDGGIGDDLPWLADGADERSAAQGERLPGLHGG